jgi:hypothetical protein
MIDSSAAQEKQPAKSILPQHSQEQVIAESVTDRLLKPVEISQHLEESYETFESMLKISDLNIDGIGKRLPKWFIEHLNTYFRNEPKFQRITTKDIGSLALVTENPFLQKFRNIYNHNYKRPVFYLSLWDYRTINSKLHGGTGDGMVISGGIVDEDPITKGLAIIVAGSGLTDATKHEIKHTLDPQLTQKRRHGKDQVLEEFAAFWGDVIIPRVITWKTTHSSGGIITKEETETKVVETTLGSVRLSVESDTYFEQYKDAFGSKREYVDTVNEVAGYIQRLQDKYDKFQIDRMLMNAVKIEELKECVKEQGL